MAELEIALKGQNNVWEDKFEEYTDENQSLGAKNIKLDNANKNLTVANQELTLVNENLTAANNKLEDDNQNLTTANQVLADDNRVLTDSNQGLISTTRSLEQKFQDSTQEQANNDTHYQDLYDQCLEMEKALAAAEAKETDLLTKLEASNSLNNQTEEADTETISSLKTQLAASETANQNLTSEITQKSESLLQANQKLSQEQSKHQGSIEKLRASHLAELSKLTEKLNLTAEQAQQDSLVAISQVRSKNDSATEKLRLSHLADLSRLTSKLNLATSQAHQDSESLTQTLEASHLAFQKSAQEKTNTSQNQLTHKYSSEISLLLREKEQITNKLLSENEELYLTLNQEKEEALASVRLEMLQGIERVELEKAETVEKFRLEISELKESENRDNIALDCKIFWEQIFASFLERNFSLQFAEPGGIWRIRQITAVICSICQICPATLKIKLNYKFWKFAYKAFLKNDIRYPCFSKAWDGPKHRKGWTRESRNSWKT